MRPAYALSIAVLLAVTASAAAAQPIVGGYQAAPAGDPDIIAAARFAVRAQGEAHQTSYALKAIVSAQKQVVAGMNYAVCMRVKGPRHLMFFGHTHLVNATVYQDLDRHDKLTAWDEVTACP